MLGATAKTRRRETSAGKTAASRMTVDQQQHWMKALEELRRFQDEMAAKYGKLEPEGWVLLNESRDERTRQLMGEDIG